MKKARIIVLSFFTLVFFNLFASCVNTQKIQNIDTLKMDSSITQGKLENGMTYYVQENHEPKNRILLRLVVKAGSVNEDEDQKGVAHFVEHLAFNGTTNFKKNQIIDYFEKIGMAFGPEVNAYTSMEETVYKLEIPADDPEMLKTSLLVLHDWASEVSFEQEEIEKERGVIIEEWRLDQGLSAKLNEVECSLLLKDSKYKDHSPIGDMDIISKIKRERIVDFYKRWYKPENMAVILVGDAKKNVLESAIKEIMGTIPKSSEPLEKTNYELPYSSQMEIKFFEHEEQKFPIIYVIAKDKDYKVIKTYEDLKNQISIVIASSCFNQRLRDISLNPNSPWFEASEGGISILNHHMFNYLGFLPKENTFIPALKRMISEYDKMLIFGIEQIEFDRVKEQISQNIELAYTNKDKISSVAIMNDLVDYVLTDEVVLSSKDSYLIAKKILKEITIQEVNEAFKNTAKDRGNKMLLVLPKKTKNVPSENELMDVWQNYKDVELMAHKEKKEADSFMQKPNSKGTVVSKKSLKTLGGTEYVLNNGIKIITKKTNYEKDIIHMDAISLGGLAYVSEEEYPSGTFSEDYAMLSGTKNLSYEEISKIGNKKNIDFDIAIRDNSEIIRGAGNNKEIESVLQLTNLIFTEPNFKDEAWKYFIDMFEIQAKSYGNSPEEVLAERMYKLIRNGNTRYAPMNMDFFKKLNQKTSEKIFFERFSNPGDFTYIFVGDFNEKSLIDLCCIYLGTLQTNETREQRNTSVFEYDFPKGIINETVYKGKDDKGYVILNFGGIIRQAKNVEEFYLDKQLFNQLQSVLEIRLREILREDKGGTYGVYCEGDLFGTKERQFESRIGFGCEPKREDELKNEVLKEIERIQKEGIDESYIQKVNETYKRSFEEKIRKNSWYMSQISNVYVYGEVPEDFMNLEKLVISNTTKEKLQELAKIYFNTQNYVGVFLKPEK